MVRLRRPDGIVRTLDVDSTTEVGRLDVGENFSFISKLQATVTVTELNVVVVSHGANPTGVRLGASAPWRWLKKGQDATVGHSAQICLDRKQHSSVDVVLTLDPEAAPTTEAAPPAPATESVPPLAPATESVPPPAPATESTPPPPAPATEAAPPAWATEAAPPAPATEAAPPPPSDEAAAAPPAAQTPAAMKQPVTPTPAGGSTVPHSSPVQWLWQSSVTRDEWRPFPPSQGDAVESGWAAAQERVSLDAERYIDLRAMKQCRTDDPTRSRRVRREPPVPDDSPARKRQHTEQAAPSLPSPPAAAVAPLASSASPTAAAPAAAPAPTAAAATASTSTPAAAAGGDEDLVPREVAPPSDASWSASRDSLLMRHAHEAPRSCAACFDMDGTLLRWTLNGEGWPNKLTDYALWSGKVAAMLQGMHADGYKLVIMSNQSKIKGAVEGSGRTGAKKNGEGITAARVRTLVDWLALRCGVPLHGLFATRNNEYRKPAPGMWAAMEQALRCHTYSCSLSCVKGLQPLTRRVAASPVCRVAASQA